VFDRYDIHDLQDLEEATAKLANSGKQADRVEDNQRQDPQQQKQPKDILVERAAA